MNSINIKYHYYYWILDFSFHAFIHYSNFDTKINFISLGIIFYNILLKMLVFYLSLKVIFPLLLDRKKPIMLSLVTILVIFLIANLGVLIDRTLMPKTAENINNTPFWSINVMLRFWYLLMMIPTAFVYWYAEKILNQEKRQQEIAWQTNELEKVIVRSELSSIKNQINPDFLFKTLHFFNVQAKVYSTNLSRAITLLSDIMSYALHDNYQVEKVPLASELKHIQNYIEIQQLRFDNRLQIILSVFGDLSEKQIMPLILITFVENAFKHGELNNCDRPLRIMVEVEENELRFMTHNYKRQGPREISGKIGLENTKKRLLLGYAGSHCLEITDEAGFYEVNLSLKV